MADPDGCPLVFHCAAGKDRTGVLAALVLSTLGVPDPDVAADYALSADAMARRLAWLRPPILTAPCSWPASLRAGWPPRPR